MKPDPLMESDAFEWVVDDRFNPAVTLILQAARNALTMGDVGLACGLMDEADRLLTSVLGPLLPIHR